jgi:4-amino-4-deoxy-L-arabinose transferase-like glycosyltransferase
MLDMLHYDEAYYAVDAISLIDFPRLTPFFPENYGRESLWMYILSPALHQFLQPYPTGAVFAIRITAIFTGVLTIAAVYRLGRELLGRRAGVWAAASLAALFWHVLMSHQGYRALLYPLVGALAFAFLWAGRRTGKAAHWIAGGVSLGLLFYTYFAARLWLGLAGLTLVYWFIVFPARRRGVLLAGGIAFAIWLPLLVYLLSNPAVASQRLDQVAVSSAGQVIDNLALWARVLVSEGIPDPVYFLKGRPLLDAATGILALLGVIALFRRGLKPPSNAEPSPSGTEELTPEGFGIALDGGFNPRRLVPIIFLFLLIAASLAPAALTTEPLKMLRAFGLVVPLALLMGAAWLERRDAVFAPPEVKTSGFQTDKSTKGTNNGGTTQSFSPFSGLGFSVAGGFNLWRRGLRMFLPTLLLLWAGVGAWRDFETWVSSPDLYLPMEQHLMQASRLIDEQSSMVAASYYTPFPPGHPVLRILSESLGKTNLRSFKGYECLVLPPSDERDYFSLDMFDPGFASRLSQWAQVEEVLAEPVDVPRWRVYRAQAHDDIAGEWGADRFEFGDMSVRLLRPLPETVRPGETLEIVLGLRTAADLTNNYTVFVHFYGDPSPYEGGAILAQVDAPLCPSHPPPAWLPGETIIQTLSLTLPPDLPSGRYHLSLGVYDSFTVERLPVTYPAGHADFIEIAEVEIPLH